MFQTIHPTICALSTPPGAGGIAIVRISGPEAISVSSQIFTPRKAGKHLLTQPAGTVVYGTVRTNNEVLDDVLATVFRTPHSFTGEDTVEFSCHGSIYIQQRLLQLLIENGARQAQAFEVLGKAACFNPRAHTGRDIKHDWRLRA
jgi:tRNA modification GTPase